MTAAATEVKPNQVRQYRVDDWYGLYVDGELVSEGHSIADEDLASILQLNQPFNYESRWVEELGNLEAFANHMPATEDELLAELEKLNEWPKYVDIYAHESTSLSEFLEQIDGDDTGLTEEFVRQHDIHHLAYEVKLTYEIEQDGKATLVACNGHPVQFDKKWTR